MQALPFQMCWLCNLHLCAHLESGLRTVAILVMRLMGLSVLLLSSGVSLRTETLTEAAGCPGRDLMSNGDESLPRAWGPGGLGVRTAGSAWPGRCKLTRLRTDRTLCGGGSPAG